MSPADLFVRPGALPLLLLVPALWVLLRARDRARAEGLFLAGLLLALLALAGPAWGEAGAAPSPHFRTISNCWRAVSAGNRLYPWKMNPVCLRR